MSCLSLRADAPCKPVPDQPTRYSAARAQRPACPKKTGTSAARFFQEPVSRKTGRRLQFQRLNGKPAVIQRTQRTRPQHPIRHLRPPQSKFGHPLALLGQHSAPADLEAGSCYITKSSMGRTRTLPSNRTQFLFAPTEGQPRLECSARVWTAGGRMSSHAGQRRRAPSMSRCRRRGTSK
jgi:hypothetical protein